MALAAIAAAQAVGHQWTGTTFGLYRAEVLAASPTRCCCSGWPVGAR